MRPIYRYNAFNPAVLTQNSQLGMLTKEVKPPSVFNPKPFGGDLEHDGQAQFNFNVAVEAVGPKQAIPFETLQQAFEAIAFLPDEENEQSLSPLFRQQGLGLNLNGTLPQEAVPPPLLQLMSQLSQGNVNQKTQVISQLLQQQRLEKPIPTGLPLENRLIKEWLEQSQLQPIPLIESLFKVLPTQQQAKLQVAIQYMGQGFSRETQAGIKQLKELQAFQAFQHRKPIPTREQQHQLQPEKSFNPWQVNGPSHTSFKQVETLLVDAQMADKRGANQGLIGFDMSGGGFSDQNNSEDTGQKPDWGFYA